KGVYRKNMDKVLLEKAQAVMRRATVESSSEEREAPAWIAEEADFQKDRQRPTETAKPLDEGRIVAVLIDSPIVGPVWFALDDGWKSGDDTPVFYASELPHLQTMTPEELRKDRK